MRLPDAVAAIDRRIPRPNDFRSPARGTRTAARVGLLLGTCIGICFLTGVWSHFQYTSPGWLPIGPDPAWLYRVTQGAHVATGTAAIPLLLVKLWSVYPRLFRRPRKRGIRAFTVGGLERASVALLVAAVVFQLVTGSLNVVQWYPWSFSFRATHEAVAYLAIGALLTHIAVKLPLVRIALNRTVDDRLSLASDGPSRRTVVLGAAAASGLAVLLTAGQTVPFLRRASVFGVRDGDGPQDLPVNRTARAAGAIDGATDPDFALELRHGTRTVRLSRAQLAELPQRTHRLPITCVEGWSRNATWTGIAVRDLVALVQAEPESVVRVRSMQTRGAFSASELPADFVADPRTLLALELNGEPLSLDHGYPCRIIAPNRPGVLQTKWVNSLEVPA
ncbi:molybdopterin-dependent oxidoreductase [Aeromicrobium sp.]|uniref:molybdopterin-dependent oxidoreductase n=1 Tax=Aeromicrobium sp. TaxID=1871063 RepID=UPI003D6BC3E4